MSNAQGYGVYEQGACTMGRGGTAAAEPCADGSGMYFNPAGIAGLPLSGSLGGTLIWPSTTWANDNTGIQPEFLSKTYVVPNLYFVAPVAQRFALGFGVFVPYGLTTEWDKETFEGRFLGYKTSLKAIYLQPTAAAQFGKLKIGAGLDITSLSVDLERKVDLSQQFAAPRQSRSGCSAFRSAPTSPTRTVTGSAWGVGYNLGATFDLTPASDGRRALHSRGRRSPRTAVRRSSPRTRRAWCSPPATRSGFPAAPRSTRWWRRSSSRADRW